MIWHEAFAAVSVVNLFWFVHIPPWSFGPSESYEECLLGVQG